MRSNDCHALCIARQARIVFDGKGLQCNTAVFKVFPAWPCANSFFALGARRQRTLADASRSGIHADGCKAVIKTC